MNSIICLYLVIIIVIVIFYCNRKENYRRYRRRGVSMGWKRAGGAGRTLAQKGTRYPKLPTPEQVYEDENN